MNARHRLLALALPLLAAFLAASPASAAIVHHFEGHFTGSDAPGGPLAKVWGASVDSSGGNVFLAESHTNGGPSSVYRFDPLGAYGGLSFNGSTTPKGSLVGLNLAGAHGAIAVEAASGDIWASDLGHGGLLDRFDENGQFVCQISGKTPSTPEEEAAECDGATGSATPDGGFTPAGLALDEGAAEVYVADSAHNAIDVFSTAGGYLRQITGAHVTAPAGIAVEESSGRLYVLDKGAGVAVFDSGGAYETTIDAAGKPTALALAPSGDLYVSDSEGEGLGQVSEYSPAGALIERFGLAQRLEKVTALAVDSSTGRLYVALGNTGAGAYVYGPPIAVPDVETGEAREVEDTAATVAGHVDPDSADGGGEVTSCRAEYAPVAEVNSVQTVSVVGAGLTGQLRLSYEGAVTEEFRVSSTGSTVGSQLERLRSIGAGNVSVTGPAGGPWSVEFTGALAGASVGRLAIAEIDEAPSGASGFVEADWSGAASTACSPATPYASAQDVSARLAGLSPNTPYYYRLMAENSSAVPGRGAERVLNTAGPAVIRAERAAAEIHSVHFDAEIDPSGHDASCDVEYVSEADYQNSEWSRAETAPCAPEDLGAGFGDQKASAEANGLQIGTTYRYRFVASSQGEAKVLGAEERFSTFGIESFSLEALNGAGEPETRVGAHPYELVTTIALTANHGLVSREGGNTGETPNASPKDILTELPPGLVGAPAAAPRCPLRVELERSCPGNTQVGLIGVELMGQRGFEYKPLFNVIPPEGVAARFGTEINGGVSAFITAGVRADEGYTVEAGTRNIPSFAIKSVSVRLWGIPADPTHDSERVGCGEEIGCASTAPLEPFLTMPSACAGPLSARARADSYQAPGEFAEVSTEMPPLTGCNRIEFAPRVEARPTTDLADSPSGLHVDIHIPQPPTPAGRSGELRCNPGAWSGAPTRFNYRWLRDGAPIPGATEPSYTETGADAGSVLQCEVEAENGAAGPGLAASRSILVAPIPSPAPPTNRLNYPVRLEGTLAAAAGTLTCNRGEWQNANYSPPITFTYRWLKDGAPVPGATGESYEVGPGETPLSLQCEVIATRGTGTASVAFSEAFASEPALEPALPSPIGSPRAALPEGDLPGVSPADLRDAVVRLPEGLTVNPSSAAGLEGCSLEQLGVSTPVGTTPIRTTGGPAECPEASKLGTVEVDTPLLDHPLPGAVYLATPYKNPFDSLLAIYIAVYDPVSGVVVKLAGEVKVGEGGQLTTTFEENPQLPFEDFKLDFFGGARAALKTPSTCGRYTATSTLTPWSAPESGPPATPTDSYEITQEPGGGSCPTSAPSQPNSPSFEAGTESPLAGAFSPFVLHLKREDGSQQFASLSVTPPPGLLGKLAGIPYCPDSALAAAEAKSGAEEQASPACPAASEIGTVTVGAGAGPSPYYVQGHAYLAGPYKGAPLSLAIVTPAVAGPYDLGTVVVRNALEVNPYTAQITVKSDPIPTELKGIPLDVRSIAVKMGRPDFILNPTDCEAMSVGGTETSAIGNTAQLTSHFQVGECEKLSFKPHLRFSLKGGTRRAGHPALTATLTMPEGGSNISRAQVALPHAELLDQGNLDKVCKQAEIASGTCPPGSVYGYAKAWSPLLEKPLEGPVFLGVGYGHKLPDLVAELNGQIRVLLHGKVDTDKADGIRNTFEVVPDAPVSKFTLSLKGGKRYGLIENSEPLCAHPQRANARFVGQNGVVDVMHPKIAAGCQSHKRHKVRAGHHHKRSRSAAS